jgi:hypothetical protein
MDYHDSLHGRNETTRPTFFKLELLLVGSGRWTQKIKSICALAEPDIVVSIIPAREFISTDTYNSSWISEFNKIWICTQPILQLQVVDKIISFDGDVILEKPYFETSVDYLKLVDNLKESEFGVLLSQPWTFSKVWQKYKSLVVGRNGGAFQITRLGLHEHSFVNPVADWLPHDLNLILDLVDDEFLDFQINTVSWNSSMSQVSFNLEVNNNYLFKINAGEDLFGRTATWTNGRETLNFLTSEISTALGGSTRVKEVHPLLDLLHTSGKKNVSRSLDFHFGVFQQLGL